MNKVKVCTCKPNGKPTPTAPLSRTDYILKELGIDMREYRKQIKLQTLIRMQRAGLIG